MSHCGVGVGVCTMGSTGVGEESERQRGKTMGRGLYFGFQGKEWERQNRQT